MKLCTLDFLCFFLSRQKPAHFSYALSDMTYFSGLRILQILHKYSDLQHPLTQEKIAYYLDSDSGIVIERKAISCNISLLMDADVEIGHCRDGHYLEAREFEDTELKLLVDSVLCNQNITAKHSADLIEKLCNSFHSNFYPLRVQFKLTTSEHQLNW